MQKKLLLAVLAGTLISLTGCKNVFRAYRIDVPQGQTITREQTEQLKPGMTPAQVRYVLGTPLITDTLNPTRWDYAYSLQPGTYALEAGVKPVAHRRLTVFFAGGVLDHVETDGDLPAKSDSLPPSKDRAVRASEASLKEDAQRP